MSTITFTSSQPCSSQPASRGGFCAEIMVSGSRLLVWGSGEKPTSKLSLLSGRIQFLWLQNWSLHFFADCPRGHSQILSTRPFHFSSRFFRWPNPPQAQNLWLAGLWAAGENSRPFKGLVKWSQAHLDNLPPLKSTVHITMQSWEEIHQILSPGDPQKCDGKSWGPMKNYAWHTQKRVIPK